MSQQLQWYDTRSEPLGTRGTFSGGGSISGGGSGDDLGFNVRVIENVPIKEWISLIGASARKSS